MQGCPRGGLGALPILPPRNHPACLRLLICGTAWLSSGLVLADPCASLPKPSVQIKRLETPLTFNRDYTVAALNILGAGANKPGHQVLGLTRGTAAVTFNSQYPRITDNAGRWECVSPQLLLTYGYKPMTVYVAREFPPGSCSHKAIHEHEMRHVETYLQHLNTIESEILGALKARFETGEPWRGPPGQMTASLRQELESRWIPYVQRLIRQVDALQAEIDTQEEYARVSSACEGEIRRQPGSARPR